MTPERMLELADWLDNLPNDTCETAEWLRECAKAEAVAFVRTEHINIGTENPSSAKICWLLKDVPEGTKLYAVPQASQPIDERAEFEKWAARNNLNLMHTGAAYLDYDVNIFWSAWQAARKLSAPQVAPVVPDGLLDAVKEIAGSHTDNEITDRPVWWIIDPRQILKPTAHEFYGSFKGPFFSREAATEYMDSHRYRYGKHVKVYCGSCNDAPQFKKLYDMSAAMLKGAK